MAAGARGRRLRGTASAGVIQGGGPFHGRGRGPGYGVCAAWRTARNVFFNALPAEGLVPDAAA